MPAAMAVERKSCRKAKNFASASAFEIGTTGADAGGTGAAGAWVPSVLPAGLTDGVAAHAANSTPRPSAIARTPIVFRPLDRFMRSDLVAVWGAPTAKLRRRARLFESGHRVPIPAQLAPEMAICRCEDASIDRCGTHE